MYTTPYRNQAKKVEVHKEGLYTYYNIFVGQYRIAEYVNDVWVDRIVDGYNLLQKQEVDIINANRARKEYDKEKLLNCDFTPKDTFVADCKLCSKCGKAFSGVVCGNCGTYLIGGTPPDILK